MTDVDELTAVEQGAAVRAGDLSPTELARHYLDRIGSVDPSIGAFVAVTEELAFEQAAEAERALADARASSVALAPLHGVPVAIKDIVRVEDVRCTMGSAAYADQIADLDDHVVARMKAAGMVIVGTTNTPEFALPCYTENRVGPPTRNPWNPERSPGGSSGGSAAAVAAGMAPVAHGTDSGGSVRIPASACGLVGLKPSRGRVSNGPVGHDVTGLTTHGALGRTVADAAALVQVMSGVMFGDAYTAPAWAADASSDRPLRVVSMPEPMLPDVPLHPDCRAAVDRAVALLEAAGHEVDEMEMSPDPAVADAFKDAWSSVAAAIAVDEEDEELLMPFTRYMRDHGRAVTGPDLHAALSTFRGIGQMMADMFFANFDVILTPTLAGPPPLIGAFTSDPDPSADFARMGDFMPYTPLYNIIGAPAVSLPLHVSDDGLPIGVMLAARYGGEPTLVAVGTQLESARGHSYLRPPARAPAAHSSRRS